MTILAGEIVTAGRLNRLQPVTYSATASSSLSLSGSEQDIPGCEITLTTITDGAAYSVVAVADCNVTTTNSTTLAETRLYIDGQLQLGRSTYALDVATRATVAAMWDGTLPSAGSHTFTLVGALTGSGGASIQATNTKMRVTITEVP